MKTQPTAHQCISCYRYFYLFLPLWHFHAKGHASVNDQTFSSWSLPSVFYVKAVLQKNARNIIANRAKQGCGRRVKETQEKQNTAHKESILHPCIHWHLLGGIENDSRWKQRARNFTLTFLLLMCIPFRTGTESFVVVVVVVIFTKAKTSAKRSEQKMDVLSSWCPVFSQHHHPLQHCTRTELFLLLINYSHWADAGGQKKKKKKPLSKLMNENTSLSLPALLWRPKRHLSVFINTSNASNAQI